MSLLARTVPLLLTVAGVVVYAGKNDAWRARPISEWSGDDAKQVLTQSPWVKTFTPDLKPAQSSGGAGPQMGRGGINMGGIGVGIPGMGRRGMGSPGGRPRQGGDPDSGQAPQLTLRWESAMPVNAAELKVHDNAPSVDEKYYALAVYGVPDRMASGDPDKLAGELKKDASIKREGKKDFKPSNVEVLQRENGTVIVYLFSRSTEITREDKRVEFNARIGRLQIIESFFTGDMTWQGKIEL
jgi:hypothetical protein